MNLRSNIKVIQSLEIMIFIVFSFLPLLATVIIEIPSKMENNAFNMAIIGTTSAIIVGTITIYALLSLRSNVRFFGTIIFSIGILVGYSDAYALAFGIILTWVFYEAWYISFHYYHLDLEYSSYSEESVERIKLREVFQLQFNSFLLLAWIALSLSWGILILSSIFFVQLGRNQGFGTLGITISVSMIFLLFFVRNLVITKSK